MMNGDAFGMETGDAATHPQGVGRSVTTRDGRRLYLMERGHSEGRAPVVVFEAGMAASRSFWGLVQPEVARRARAVVYDRAGLGRSEPDGRPRTLARMADDLDALGDGPFVLVGHSGGALIVRAVAERRPGRIAGLVLVDPSDEGCEAVFAPSFRLLERLAHRLSVLLARLGLLERAYSSFTAPLPARIRAELSEEGFTRGVMRTRGAELAGMRAALDELRHTARTTGMPVTVISGARADMGMSPGLRAAANAAHARRAGLSAAGRHVLAARSGHMVPVTEPGVIAAEIARLLAARNR